MANPWHEWWSTRQWPFRNSYSQLGRRRLIGPFEMEGVFYEVDYSRARQS